MANTDQMANETQRHPKFYIPSGDMVIQVERTIFKIHSHFLTTESEVFRDMITAAPRSNEHNDGTDSEPLILSGDSVKGWELFLSSIYRANSFKFITFTGKQSIQILRITHKYCMQSAEDELISRLKEETGTVGFLNLMVASRIVDSKELYDTALKGLIASEPKPTFEEANMIGMEAYHAIMSQSWTTRKCGYCHQGNNLRTKCLSCHQWQ
ncbi:hypothetical protein M408DRAFT_328572 [Serendipita vermifera MAFF 305830]|uniref:BTB domain-containing protein n=1 Tax=Serendipita vermifera MAFF 305830 TaxID=933852 RepID=A0A0C2WU81_SERVB|nr:hypothetical protein M408DRAFT_328572 [Serendipita vermifera MAFF 305830]